MIITTIITVITTTIAIDAENSGGRIVASQ